jgi:peptide/nickel transport system substrate-binding protein
MLSSISDNRRPASHMRRRNGKVGLLAALCALAVAGLPACGGSSGGSTGGTGGEGGSSITVATSTTLKDSLDPHGLNQYGPNQVDFNNVFEPLVRWAPGNDSVIEPVLATSWELVAEDTMQFKLREGVKFQNDEEFNADSVVFSIKRLINPDLNSIVAANVGGTLKDAVAVDATTVNIQTDGPDPIILNRLTKVMIVPPGYLDNEELSKKLDDAPIGTGPYKFSQRTAEGGVDLEAWDGYWGTKANVKTVHLIAREDDTARVAALKTNEAQIIIDAPVNDVDSLPSTVEIPSLEVTTLRLNGLGRETADVKLREAITMAIDTETIRETFFGDHAVSAQGQVVPEGVAGFNDQVGLYPYDPEAAKKLVEQSSYDGTAIPLEYPGGGRFPRGKEVSEAIVNQLLDVGINAQVNEQPFDTWLDDATHSNADSPAMLYSRPGSDGVRDGGEPFSIFVATGGLCNVMPADAQVTANEIYQKAIRETDLDVRDGQMAEVSKILHDSFAQAPLFVNNYIWGVAEGVTWDVTQDDLIRLATIKVG